MQTTGEGFDERNVTVGGVVTLIEKSRGVSRDTPSKVSVTSNLRVNVPATVVENVAVATEELQGI